MVCCLAGPLWPCPSPKMLSFLGAHADPSVFQLPEAGLRDTLFSPKLSPGTRQLLPALASPGGISRILRPSLECRACLGSAKPRTQVGRLWSSWVGQGQLQTLWLEPRHWTAVPPASTSANTSTSSQPPSQGQHHCSRCSSGLGVPMKLSAILGLVPPLPAGEGHWAAGASEADGNWRLCPSGSGSSTVPQIHWVTFTESCASLGPRVLTCHG